MKPTSPHTIALIQRLYEPLTLRERLTQSRNYVAILSDIGDSNEPSAIIHILPFVFSRSDTAFAAATAVHKLLRGTSPTELAWLDPAVRQHSTYPGEYFFDWHKVSAAQFDELERLGSASVSVLGLTSFHRNGYVREAAIRRLSLVASGDELPFLILRLNDWVSNVRDAAYKAVRSRIKPEYCPKFIANLTLLSRLEYAGRADHKEIVEAINELLQSDECRTTLLESLNSADRFIRRASFRLALDSTKSDFQQVATQALDDRDTVIRRWAAQTISSTLRGATLENFMNRMKRDRFMPVRREALRIAVELNQPNLIEELQRALLDSHASMREEARYHLRRIHPMDLAAFYREYFITAEPHTLYSAISGLGETGTAEDDSLIVPYSVHPASKIRRAAIKALAMLRLEAHIDVFLQALGDEVHGVSRQAAKALVSKTSSVSAGRVWEVFSSTSHVHVKRNALSVIEKFTKWESIYYLVRALCETDGDIVAMSELAIQRWLVRFNRSFSVPSSEQVAKLKEALEKCGKSIDEKTQRQLRFSIHGY